MRSPAWRGPAPAEIAAWSLVQAGHAVGRRFWAALAEVGLTPVQFGTLLQLDLEPGLSNAALARIVLVTPQSMSDLLGGLAEQGLVDRPPPAGRGHPVTARLTTAGRRRLRRCEPLIEEVERSLGLTATELRTMNRLLHKALAGGAI